MTSDMQHLLYYVPKDLEFVVCSPEVWKEAIVKKVLPCDEVMCTVAAYIVLMLDTHLIKFLVEKLVS